MFLYDLLWVYFRFVSKKMKPLLTPRTQEPPPVSLVSRLARAVSVAAALIVVLRSALTGPGDPLGYGLVSLSGFVLQSVPLIVVSIFIGTLVMVFMARPGYRRQSLRELSGPIRLILGVFGSIILGTAASVGCFLAIGPLGNSGILGGAALFGTFALMILGAFLAVTVWGMLWAVWSTISNHLFAVRDAHPALPAVVSLVLVALSMVQGWAEAVPAILAGAIPSWVDVLVLVLAPAVGLAAGSFELRWLRKDGVDIRLPASCQLPAASRGQAVRARSIAENRNR